MSPSGSAVSWSQMILGESTLGEGGGGGREGESRGVGGE